MKQRMYNTFSRILKNHKIAKILSEVGYMLLMAYYMVARNFVKNKCNSISVDEARKKLMGFSEKPHMNTTIQNKEKTIDLSIIVPAYNAENTIKECILSVIEQKTKYSYELIVVNDGSSDETEKIVKSIENKKIVLIDQENRGFSGARNRGIDESNGKYIMFLDSDDTLVGSCIESMMDLIIGEDADIVQGSFYSYVEGVGNKNYCKLSNSIITDKNKMIGSPGYPWAKIYKREMFNNLRFPLNVWFEDTIVCLILYRMCKKMVVTSDIVYAYRLNPEGITMKARHNRKCVDHYWVMEYVLEKANELGMENDELQYLLVKGHMSTLLYRRISLQSEEIIESTFILASQLLDRIRPKEYNCTGKIIQRDIEQSFKTKNYKLWKLASFIV